MQAGQLYLVSENTPRSELFVPAKSGAILNVAQAQAALRGSSAAAPLQINLTVEASKDLSVVAGDAGRDATVRVIQAKSLAMRESKRRS